MPGSPAQSWIFTWPYWPRPPGLADELALAVGAARERFLVGDLRLADGRLDVELALQAVDDDLEVQLAHAGDDHLAGLLVGVHAEGRVFRHQLLSATPSFSWSAFVFGSIASEMTGSGNVIDSRTIGCFSSQIVSPVETLFRPTAARDVARVDFLDFLALVRVHLQEAADALVRCFVAL